MMILLDACSLINIVGSLRCEEVLRTSPDRFAVPRYVIENETLRFHSGPDGDERRETQSTDLSGLPPDTLLQVDLESDTERDTFVRFATEIDDGEAYCGALAVHRSWAIATDDRKARNVFARQIPPIPLFSTAQLLRRWSAHVAEPVDGLRTLLNNIERRARFRPGDSDPESLWWNQCLRR